MRPKATTDRYLKKRGEVFWYKRRVPRAYAGVDTRIWIEESLRTRSLETARIRRDLKVEADEACWRALLLGVVDSDRRSEDVKAATSARYEAARARALEADIVYRPAEQLAERESAAALLERFLAARVTGAGHVKGAAAGPPIDHAHADRDRLPPQRDHQFVARRHPC